jgi:hypothetical protein
MGQCLRTHFDDLSAFHTCGHDLLELFKSTAWAFYGRVTDGRFRQPDPEQPSFFIGPDSTTLLGPKT